VGGGKRKRGEEGKERVVPKYDPYISPCHLALYAVQVGKGGEEEVGEEKKGGKKEGRYPPGFDNVNGPPPRGRRKTHEKGKGRKRKRKKKKCPGGRKWFARLFIAVLISPSSPGKILPQSA